jgi:hypothetical protein
MSLAVDALEAETEVPAVATAIGILAVRPREPDVGDARARVGVEDDRVRTFTQLSVALAGGGIDARSDRLVRG